MAEVVQSFAVPFAYPVLFTRGAFRLGNPILRRTIERAGRVRHRVLVAVDTGVLDSDPGFATRLVSYFDEHRDRMELVQPPFRVRGGEICKSEPREVAELQALVARHHLCRHSFVLAIGGGAVLDATGFAVATAHRGIRILRMPSTVLAQNDAGIGVKNAVNAFGRKNFLGTFAPPFAVVNDFDLLETLDERDRRAGLAEAVKVALIRDRAFFDFLHAKRRELARFDARTTEAMIVRCAELHLQHIRTSGDPFEMGTARPLDFGHWVAHKLEESSCGELRHGEAVAIGIAVDSLYSQSAGMIGESELHRILATLEELGFRLWHPRLADLEVRGALGEFREHLGGELCITLLDGIGTGVQVGQIDAAVMQKCIAALAARQPT